jgi:malonate-semialdehyde dehydrogenase (acetylating)/methylmalonate-semialdehyde dehydrogenase
MNTALNLIEGSWREVAADFVDDVFDPATGEVIAKLPYSRPLDVDEAIGASATALHHWARLPVNERLEPLVRLRSLIDDQAADLASLIVEENGKTTAEARDEVRQAIKIIDSACEAPAILSWASINPLGADERSVRVPAGVCAGECALDGRPSPRVREYVCTSAVHLQPSVRYAGGRAPR